MRQPGRAEGGWRTMFRGHDDAHLAAGENGHFRRIFIGDKPLSGQRCLRSDNDLILRSAMSERRERRTMPDKRAAMPRRNLEEPTFFLTCDWYPVLYQPQSGWGVL